MSASQTEPRTGPTSARRTRTRWDLVAGCALLLVTAAMWARAWRQSAEIGVLTDAPVKQAMAEYRAVIAPQIKWNSIAPDFTAADGSGKQIRMSALRAKTPLFVLAFIGGKIGANDLMAGDLLGLLKRFRPRGLSAALVIEPKGERSLPQWLVAMLGCPVLRDPSGRIGRAYGVTQSPMTVLMDRSGRVLSTEPGFTETSGASDLRQDLETRLLGRAILPRYDAPKLTVGDRFPDFLAETGDESRFDLDDLRGKQRMIVVSEEGCRACGGLSETLHPEVEALGKKGGVTVWVNLADKPEQNVGSTPGIVEVRDPFGNLRHALQRESLPCVFLIDRNGTVREVQKPPIKEGGISGLDRAIASID